MTEILISKTEEETRKIGEKIGSKLDKGSLILLDGPLGSGKTVLVKGIAKSLNIEEEITSPSFTIISEYQGYLQNNPSHKVQFFHVDLYRIENAEEIEDLGLDDIIYSNGIVVIEWGEKLEPILPDSCIKISISIQSDLSRRITIRHP